MKKVSRKDAKTQRHIVWWHARGDAETQRCEKTGFIPVVDLPLIPNLLSPVSCLLCSAGGGA